jgi:endoglucanase
VIAAGAFAVAGLAVAQDPPRAQSDPTAAVGELLAWFAGAPGVTGAEHAVVERIRGRLPDWATLVVDNMGSCTVSIGSGAPVRMVLCHLDEVGWRVSRITDEGYLRLVRPGHRAGSDLADSLLEGKQVVVQGDKGELPAAVTSRSTHLRGSYPEVFDLDQAFVDIGAATEAEARALGAAEMAPVAWRRFVRTLAGNRLAGPALGDRVGAAVIVEAMRRVQPKELSGTVIFAFAAQLWHRAKGPIRLAVRFQPATILAVAASGKGRLGGGVAATAGVRELHPDVTTQVAPIEDPRAAAFSRHRAQVETIGVPVRYRRTPVEMVDTADAGDAVRLVVAWLREQR